MQLAALVLLIWHLWTIWTAAQERSTYELLLDRLHTGGNVQWGVRLLIVACLTCALLPRPRRVWRGMFTSSNSSHRLASLLSIIAASFLLIHLSVVGGLTRQLIEYDVFCAQLSSTVYGVPAWALLHVLGVAATGGCLSLAVRARVERMGARAGTWLPALVFVIVFCLGTAVVLEWATGSAVPLVL